MSECPHHEVLGHAVNIHDVYLQTQCVHRSECLCQLAEIIKRLCTPAGEEVNDAAPNLQERQILEPVNNGQALKCNRAVLLDCGLDVEIDRHGDNRAAEPP